jgi:predicted DNA-binding WGR domain protein
VRLRAEGAAPTEAIAVEKVAAEKKPATRRKPVQVASEEPAANAGSTGNAVSVKRYFELVAGSSAKFWEIEMRGTDVSVRYGRIGSAGQTSEKSFADTAAAQKHAEKLIQEKLDKGYVERDDASN